jgi:valyl-tRNA synthetase
MQAVVAADGKDKKEKAAKPVKVEKVNTWGAPGSGKAKKEAEKEKTKVEKKEIVFVETAEGLKKDMTTEMNAEYHPKHVESAWSSWWEKQGYFTPDAKTCKGTVESKRFVMVIPPPNVTGSLHLGHTLTTAIEDALARWHRMCGNAVLWVPGTDHAGIATQSVVERILYKEEKLTRHDLGREEFLKKVWAWKEKNGDRICSQLRRIAASVDWSRERFTMDAMLSKATQAAFVRFHEQGLIYRDNRLVNWCPHLRTALSDLEVDHEDLPGKTFIEIPGYAGKVEVGVMNEFKYMLKDSKDFLVVATTRTETMLGDVAVCVHPDDDRYKKYHGKQLVHPFFPDRKMVVIPDAMVDKEFGTGCVKITPAHDRNDFAVGKKHGLENLNCFDENGNINEKYGAEFKGQHRFEARGTIEEALKAKGLWVGKKSHPMRLGLCSRSKDIIEPYLKPQWWMDCKELAAKAVAAVREGELKILPEFHHQTWYHWLENIQDWCISRQLWWGHRVPAYKVIEPPQKEEVWVSATSMEEAEEKAKKKLGVKNVKMEQDSDVLDTWFSSGLFPFSVFNWPDCGDDFDAFFPTSLLETGHDILFFWVARMVMMSIGLVGKLPFHTVYLHAMVRDAHGKKMSKSSGNVIDPIEVIEGITLDSLNKKLTEGNLPEKEIARGMLAQKEQYPDGIPECGADALRFGMLAYTLQGRNVNLDVNRVVGYRHFCNKVWQGSRFGLRYFGEGFTFPGSLNLAQTLAWEDKWILSKLSACAEKSNNAFKAYEFANATTATYNFFLYELCDVYLELLKGRLQGEETPENAPDRKVAREVLYVCLDWSLRLMHPLLPYLTEELYQRLPPSPSKYESVVIASYPTHVIAWKNEALEDEFEVVAEIAKRMRSQKTSLGFAPSARPNVFVRHTDETWSFRLPKLCSQLSRMGQVGEVKALKANAASPKGVLQDVVNKDCLIFTEVAGLDLKQELVKLSKKAESVAKVVAQYEAKLNMPGYEDKVPELVREKNADKLKEAQVEGDELKKAIASIKSIA